MKKPSLRFRQVFEHPTHFKVTKPLGNPLIIARSLNFAPTEIDEQMVDAPSAQLDLSPRSVSPRSPISFDEIMASPNFVGEDEPVVAGDRAPIAGDIGLDESFIKPAAVPVLPAPAPAPAPAPVTVNVVTPQQPDAKQQIQASEPSVGQPSEPKPAVTPPASAVQPAATPVAPVTFEQRQAELARQMQDVAGQIPAAEKAAQDERARLIKEAEDKTKSVVDGAITARNEAMTKYQSAIDSEKPFFYSLDTAQKIGAVASMFIGAIAAGITGRPNSAMAIYDKAMDRELEQQRQRRNSLFNRYREAGLDVRAAESMYRAFGERVLADKLSNAAAGVNNLKARADILKEAAKINDDAKRREIEAFGKVAEANFKNAETKEILAKIPLLGKMTPYQEAQLKETRRHNVAVEGIGRTRADAAALVALGKAGGDGASVPEMGAEIPDFLRGAKPEELRKYRVEYIMPGYGSDGKPANERKVGFLIDPKSRKDFQNLSNGFAVAKRQAVDLRDWAEKNPSGLAGLVASGPMGFQKAIEERNRLEAATKTMIEGYIKNVTGIRRASSAAIKYMQGVVKNPSELSEFIDTYFGGNTARFNEIIYEIEAGENDLRNTFLAGGSPAAAESSVDRGVTFKRAP